jgi:hypothetical protein
MIVKRTAAFHVINFTDHFKIEEFFCQCGTCDYQKVDMMLVLMLQKLRHLVKRAIRINSPYRCPARNAAVGGAKASLHMEGCAADVAVVGMSGIELARAALQVGFRHIGVAKNWIHVDTRDFKGLNVWTYDGVDVRAVEEILKKDLGGSNGTLT